MAAQTTFAAIVGGMLTALEDKTAWYDTSLRLFRGVFYAAEYTPQLEYPYAVVVPRQEQAGTEATTDGPRSNTKRVYTCPIDVVVEFEAGLGDESDLPTLHGAMLASVQTAITNFRDDGAAPSGLINLAYQGGGTMLAAVNPDTNDDGTQAYQFTCQYAASYLLQTDPDYGEAP